MDIYPRRLHDDGMAYGVDEEVFTEAFAGKDYINFFTQKSLDDKMLDTWFSEQQEYAKNLKKWYDSRQLETN